MSACNCITTANGILAERNTRLTLPITMRAISDLEEPQRLLVVTEQVEKGRWKKRACSMFATYCPFCGTIYGSRT